MDIDCIDLSDDDEIPLPISRNPPPLLDRLRQRKLSTMKMIVPNFIFILILLNKITKHLIFLLTRNFHLVITEIEKSYLISEICLDKHFLYVNRIKSIAKLELKNLIRYVKFV